MANSQTAALASRSTTSASQRYAWLVWFLGAAVFFSSYLGRVGPGVMTDELMRDLNVDIFALGGMAALFYYPYLIIQIPVGSLVDHFGARRLMTAMALLCGLSCAAFGMAHSLWHAEIARIIMGFSAAFAFVGTMKIATVWFPPSRLGLLAGFTQGLGMLGAAMGEGPVAYVVSLEGWRETMLFIAAILMTLGVIIGLVLRDKSQEGVTLKPVKMLQGLVVVVKNRISWANAIYAGLLFAPTVAVAELWGASFVHASYGLPKALAASSISAIFLGWAVGGPLIGAISDKIGKRKPMMYFSALSSLLMLYFALNAPSHSFVVIFCILFAYGVCNTGVGIAYAVSGEVHQTEYAGISMAFTNMVSVLVGACLQPAIGWLLRQHWDHTFAGDKKTPVYSAFDFHHALSALPICLVLACIVVFFLPETFGRRYGEK